MSNSVSASSSNTITGTCFCKAVQFSIQLFDLDSTSNLTLSAYCHCTSCQLLNASPFVWTTHWKHQALQFNQTSSSSSTPTPSIYFPPHLKISLPDHIQIFESMPGRKLKLRCHHCGSPIGSYNLIKHEWTIWGPTLQRLVDQTHLNHSNLQSLEPGKVIKAWDFIKPTVHQFYGTRLLDLTDGLSRWVGYENQSERLG